MITHLETSCKIKLYLNQIVIQCGTMVRKREMVPFVVTGKKWDVLDTSLPLTAAYMQMYRNMYMYINQHMFRK